MALDPSIPLKAGQGVAAPNPLDTVGKVVGIGNALANNRLIGIQSDTAAQGRAQDANTWIAQQAFALYGMAKDDPRRAWGELENVLLTGIATGRISEQDAQQAKRYLGGTADEQHFRERLFRIGAASLGIPQQAEQAAGTIGMVNTGGTVQPVAQPSAMQRMQNPGMGPVALPGAIPTTMDPATATGVEQVPEIGPDGNPTGRMRYVTRAEIARQTGQQGPPGVNPAFPPGYTGRPPAAAGAPAGAPAASAPALPSPPRPTGSLGTSMAPGQPEALRAAGTSAAEAANNLASAADAANGRRAQLNTMISDLAKLRSTGPGTAGQMQLEAFLQKYAGLGITLTAEEVAAGEGFAKVARTLAGQQAGALGVASDQRLMNALGANPNLDLSKRGNAEILAMLKGNEDAIIAKNEAWQKWLASGKTPDTYNQFQTDFNRRFDPRVFHWNNMYQSMTPAERATYYEKLPDKEAFRRAYNEAVRNGWIKLPGG